MFEKKKKKKWIPIVAHILQLMSEKFQCMFKVYYSSKQNFSKNTLKDKLN